MRRGRGVWVGWIERRMGAHSMYGIRKTEIYATDEHVNIPTINFKEMYAFLAYCGFVMAYRSARTHTIERRRERGKLKEKKTGRGGL